MKIEVLSFGGVVRGNEILLIKKKGKEGLFLPGGKVSISDFRLHARSIEDFSSLFLPCYQALKRVFFKDFGINLPNSPQYLCYRIFPEIHDSDLTTLNVLIVFHFVSPQNFNLLSPSSEISEICWTPESKIKNCVVCFASKKLHEMALWTFQALNNL